MILERPSRLVTVLLSLAAFMGRLAIAVLVLANLMGIAASYRDQGIIDDLRAERDRAVQASRPPHLCGTTIMPGETCEAVVIFKPPRRDDSF